MTNSGIQAKSGQFVEMREEMFEVLKNQKFQLRREKCTRLLNLTYLRFLVRLKHIVGNAEHNYTLNKKEGIKR